MIKYLMNNSTQVVPSVIEHLQIVIIAVLISILIAFPLGVFIVKNKKYADIINSICNFIYAIPTLAMYAALIPFCGLGKDTAIIAMIVYNQYILVKNISEGFNEVDPGVIESAQAMGMTSWQVFYSVEMPLAMPLIISGIKLASLGTVSGATLAAAVGGGGLGRLLISGLAMQKWAKVRAATCICAIIALLLTAVFHYLENKALKKSRGDK